MTVLETIRRGTEFLAARGVESPRLQMEWILAHVLGVPRLQLYLQFERALTDEQVSKARQLVQCRGRREPLQHLLGTTHFCGLELRVRPEVLIPRPETEQLAEKALQFLRLRGEACPCVLDLGTGSGCLIIAVAAGWPGAVCHAVDISPKALELARDNAHRHDFGGRINFWQGDAFTALPAGLAFDLVISNPPYIPTGEIASLEPEVRDHDPQVALDGGADGLDFFRRIAVEACRWLRPGGRLMVEMGDGQAEVVRRVFEGHNWVVGAAEEDYSQRPRFLQAWLEGNR